MQPNIWLPVMFGCSGYHLSFILDSSSPSKIMWINKGIMLVLRLAALVCPSFEFIGNVNATVVGWKISKRMQNTTFEVVTR